MNKFYSQIVHTDFHVEVMVNGSRILYSGSGEGDAQNGIVDVRVRTEDGIPSGFQTGVLSFTLITGQADISRKGEVTNPFQLSFGAYKARRTLNIPGYGKLIADYVVSPPVGNRRKASFLITGDVRLPVLASIEPTIETWQPQGDCECNGHFKMIWNTIEGRRLYGVTETVYKFPRPIPNPQFLARSINFKMNATRRELFQSETIRLYKDTSANQVAMAELAFEAQ